jgi:hypothetical protein
MNTPEQKAAAPESAPAPRPPSKAPAAEPPAPPAFLFSWNPGQWPWDSLEQDADSLRAGQRVSLHWRCHSLAPEPGDRAFIVRVGEGGGIVASGWVSQPPAALDGDDQRRVELQLERLSPAPLVPTEALEGEAAFAAQKVWRPRSAGIAIAAPAARALEGRWRAAVGPEAWVRLAGSSSDRGDPALAAALGQALARRGLGLIVHDRPHLEATAAEAYLATCHTEGLPAHLRVYRFERWTAQLLGGVLIPLEDSHRLMTDSLFQAAALVTMDGGERTGRLTALAAQRGLPALAVEDRAGLGRALAALPGARSPGDAAPEVSNDRFEAVEDQLDFTSQAHTFAELIASEHTEPPLAIGLFGAWGAGKSYFMHLMRQEIRGLAGTGRPYLPQICQVEFNAWSYVDDSLWASLATGIFQGIARHIEQDAAMKAALNLEDRSPAVQLRRKLRSNRERRQEALRNYEALSRDLISARRRQKLAALSLKTRSRALAGMLARRAWDAAYADKQGPLRKAFRSDDADLAWQKAQALGLDEVLRGVVDDPVAARERLEEAGRWRVLLAFFKPNTRARWLLLALFLVVAAAFPVAWLWLGRLRDWWALLGISAVAVLPPILTALKVAFTEVLPYLRTLSAFTRTLELNSDWLLDVLKVLESADEAGIAAAAAEVARLETELQRYQQEASERAAEIAAVESELQQIAAGGALYSFVSERAGDGYKQFEGVIAALRRDLEALGTTLHEWQQEAADQGSPVTPIRRIVLYIDDLDRCEQSVVIDVLQAVHLLLAFPLFVVVVGVDPRWLEWVLRARYPQLEDDGTDAFDYLEKIFQVPYCLTGFPPERMADLVESLVPTREEVALARDPGAAQQTDRDDAGTESPEDPPGPLQQSTAPDNTPTDAANTRDTDGVDQDATDGAPDVGPGDARRDAHGSVAPDTAEHNAPGDTPGSDTEAVDRQPLFLEAWERAHIATLGDLLETPRQVKRFVNLYRLLRLGALQRADAAAWRAFVGEAQRPGTYPAYQLLLALSIAHPPGTRALLSTLVRGEGADWPGLLDAAAARGEEGAEIASLLRRRPGDPPNLSALRAAAPRVARFGYHPLED